MKASLRIAAQFDPEISTKFSDAGLTKAIILDDAANLMHVVSIEYAEKEDELYRRLTYTLTAMQTGKDVIVAQNNVAEQLLYRLSTALSGSTLEHGRLFSPTMFQAGKDEDGVPLPWDDVLPTDKKKRATRNANKANEVNDE